MQMWCKPSSRYHESIIMLYPKMQLQHLFIAQAPQQSSEPLGYGHAFPWGILWSHPNSLRCCGHALSFQASVCPQMLTIWSLEYLEARSAQFLWVTLIIVEPNLLPASVPTLSTCFSGVHGGYIFHYRLIIILGQQRTTHNQFILSNCHFLI